MTYPKGMSAEEYISKLEKTLDANLARMSGKIYSQWAENTEFKDPDQVLMFAVAKVEAVEKLHEAEEQLAKWQKIWEELKS